MLMTRAQMEKIKQDLEIELEQEGNGDIEPDDVQVIGRWHHNTNIEASNELLARLKEFHPEKDKIGC